MVDLEKWGNKAARVILQPGPIYKGLQIMLDEQRIRNEPELNTIDQVRSFLNELQERYRQSTNRFFIMRGLTDNTLDLIRTITTELGWSVIHHDSVDTIPNVNALMSSPPARNLRLFPSNSTGVLQND